MSSSSPGRILNVNDIADARASKTTILRADGFDVIEAATAAETLEPGDRHH